MNKDYLDKVVDQLVSESIIEGRILIVPYSVHLAKLPLPLPFFSRTFPIPSASFSEFLIKVYGLTKEEIKYVWKQYRSIINNKI